jgi:hypothetical protein
MRKACSAFKRVPETRYQNRAYGPRGQWQAVSLTVVDTGCPRCSSTKRQLFFSSFVFRGERAGALPIVESPTIFEQIMKMRNKGGISTRRVSVELIPVDRAGKEMTASASNLCIRSNQVFFLRT